jgi:hypothetical protein
MADPTPTEPTRDAGSFARQAEQPQQGLLAEFWDFLRTNKKWWLTPIIAMLLLIMLLFLVVVFAPASAPFIYTLF